MAKTYVKEKSSDQLTLDTVSWCPESNIPHLVGSHIIMSWPRIWLRKLVHEGRSRGVVCCPAIGTGLPAIQSFSCVKMFFYKRKREVGGNNLVWPETESEQTGKAGTGLARQGQNQALVSILLHVGSAGGTDGICSLTGQAGLGGALA